MFARLAEKIEKRRAQAFVDSVGAWYQTCSAISEVTGDVLYDDSIGKMEIGYLIDHVDRLLFSMRAYIPQVQGGLKRWNLELAQRLECASQQVYQLRNHTTSFLIRSQGPGPMTGDQPDDEARLIYYYQALDEVGFRARDIKKDLDAELKSIWPDLQKLIFKAESIAHYQ
jgi:hypothetical protein